MTDRTRADAHQPLGPWRVSSFTDGSGSCVEVAPAAGGVLVRNSNRPEAGAIHFTNAELRAFLLGARAGEFDDLAAGS